MTERIIELEERTILTHADQADAILSALNYRNIAPFHLESKRPDVPDEIFPAGCILYDSVRACASKTVPDAVILRHRFRVSATPIVGDMTDFDRFEGLDFAGQQDLSPTLTEQLGLIQSLRDQLAESCKDGNELRSMVAARENDVVVCKAELSALKDWVKSLDDEVPE